MTKLQFLNVFSKSSRLLEQCGIRASSKLITSLVTEGYTVGKLIQILTELRLYWIADYLAVDILRGNCHLHI